MTVRLPEGVKPFLEAAAWGDAAIEPLAGDASFRRYFRIRAESGATAMLMDAPPPHEDPRPFLHVAKYLCGAGFRAPQILAEDLARGLVLIEDFGDDRMREHIDAHPEDEVAIYTHAVDTLVRLAKAPVAQLAAYDAAAYLRETALLAEWYLPAMGIATDVAEYEAIWREALAPLCENKWQQVTVLRDYHAENIMLLSDGEQGLIDFQDALAGHPAYDLVSILQDARRDVSPELEAAMLDHYRREAAVSPDFDLHYALLGAQRNAKIIGIFTRLWKRDGKERYLSFLPRMWGLLERDLAHPGLVKVRDWFDRTIPQEIRASSPLDLVA
ncbi:aminoglycoside phosphotransferase family protein [Sphingorhabdus sp.]|uniref:aminoglycoside phosphotransferase family protein n=1 Tax=Sphingorhabdus sp. TaxID=1902408 RepID=UPI0037CABB3A